MQVKEYLQALSDDGKIHVEKIGSGNWYWSFASEETARRTLELAKLKAEMEGVAKGVEELEEKVAAAARAEREAEEKEGEGEREALEGKVWALEEEVKGLKKELEVYKDADPGELERKQAEVEGFKARAERWTDNLFLVEGYIERLMGGSKEGMEALRRECYGQEYIEGEGLAEL